MKREALVSYLDDLLKVSQYADYCPNGLQVEGSHEIHTLVAGVSANQALLDYAVKQGADAVLVHHGWFWKNEPRTINGIRKKRLQTLLNHNINLFAYHLPLDAQSELGNNAQLAKLFNWTIDGTFGEQNLGLYGQLAEEISLEQLTQEVATKLHRTPLTIGCAQHTIKRIAWCSGGAQDWFTAALDLGVDAYLSGEISEQHVHLAHEHKVAYIAAGHHATERLGIRALAAHLTEYCGINCQFIDIDNPV